MSNKTLGVLALTGAPFLFIGMYTEHHFYKNLNETWFTGAWGFTYMLGWMCSIAALQRLNATGNSRFGKGILKAILITLTLANVYNLAQLTLPTFIFKHFVLLDAFWPISNLLMLVIGITTLTEKQLPGWKRYVPLVVGLWLPVAILALLMFGRTTTGFVIGGFYSAVAWSLLAIMVFTTKPEFETRLKLVKNYQSV